MNSIAPLYQSKSISNVSNKTNFKRKLICTNLYIRKKSEVLKLVFPQTTKFLNVNAIPDKYVQHNYSLQGVVREVQQNGRLKVEHIPILELKAFSKYDIPKGETIISGICLA